MIETISYNTHIEIETREILKVFQSLKLNLFYQASIVF